MPVYVVHARRESKILVEAQSPEEIDRVLDGMNRDERDELLLPGDIIETEIEISVAKPEYRATHEVYGRTIMGIEDVPRPVKTHGIAWAEGIETNREEYQTVHRITLNGDRRALYTNGHWLILGGEVVGEDVPDFTRQAGQLVRDVLVAKPEATVSREALLGSIDDKKQAVRVLGKSVNPAYLREVANRLDGNLFTFASGPGKKPDKTDVLGFDERQLVIRGATRMGVIMPMRTRVEVPTDLAKGTR